MTSPLYARFIEIEPSYYYPGVIDHYPEGSVVAYGEKINAVFNVEGFEDGLTRITTSPRMVFETEIILKKGSLAAQLLSPFDSAGGAVDRLVLPRALVGWAPDIGDEVMVDGQPAVVVGAGTASDGGVSRDAVKALENAPPSNPDGPCPDYRSLMFSHGCGWTRDFDLTGVRTLKVFHLPAPIYGETFGGAMKEYSFQPSDAKLYAFKDRDEVYRRVAPMLGRDRVDMCFEKGVIGFYRQHCGPRVARAFKCVRNEGTCLKLGARYAIDSVWTGHAKRVAVSAAWSESNGMYAAYDKDRFDLSGA